MRVVNVVNLVSLFVILHDVQGISNREKQLLDEEFRRGAEELQSSTNKDQLETDTFQQNTYHSISGYGGSIPRNGYLVHEGTDNLYEHGPDIANIYGHNTDLHHSYGYGPNLLQAYGHGSNFGHTFGHTSDIGHNYENNHEAIDSEHHNNEGGFGITNIGNYIKKKLTLKKIFLPIAGMALLAAAGALTTTNPVLLQLGTISTATSGKGRFKRSNVQQNMYPKNPFLKRNIKNKTANKMSTLLKACTHRY